jgi:ADP-heptose:LPS heptosyltransferase
LGYHHRWGIILRTLTLRRGITYSIGKTVFKKDEPVPFSDERMLNRLIYTKLFEENPPLCYYFIRRKQGLPITKNRLARIGNDWIRIPEKGFVRLTRYQWSNLEESGQYEVVPPIEVMDRYVSEGKPNFSLLIIRDMGAGDVIIATDVIYNIRLRYPEAKIVFATSDRYTSLVNNLAFISEVHSIDECNPSDYDVSVNLCGWSEQYPLCAKVHRSDMFGRAFSDDFPWIEHKISLELYPEENDWFLEFNKVHNPTDKKIVCIQPYGSSGHRSLRPIHVNSVIDWFASNGYFVYVYGQSQWPNVFPNREGSSVTLWDEISLRQVISLIANSSLLICPDSSGYHIAAAFGTPSIPIFTTIHEGVRVTYYPKCYPLRASELSCSPCWDRPCGLSEAMNCCGLMSGERIIKKCEEVIDSGFKDCEHPVYSSPDWN